MILYLKGVSNMNRIKMIFITIFFIGLTFICTGCTNDDMQNINIIVTNYPNEYIVSKLYGDYSTIKSVYPEESSSFLTFSDVISSLIESFLTVS